MKEYFPSPQEVVFYVQNQLETGGWNWSNMPASERNEEAREELELLDYVVPEPEDDLDLSEMNLTPASSEVFVSQAEQVFAEYIKDISLEEVAAQAKVELPQFHRLMTVGYIPKGRSHQTGNTWYGITTDWNLHRYQYLPSRNTFTVCENVPLLRLQELIMAIAFRLEATVSTFSYGKSYKEDLQKMQIRLLSAGFSIEEAAAQYLIKKMPEKEEIMSTFMVKQNQFQW